MSIIIKVINGQIGLSRIINKDEKPISFESLYKTCLDNYDKNSKKFSNLNLTCDLKLDSNQEKEVLRFCFLNADMLKRLELFNKFAEKEIKKRKIIENYVINGDKFKEIRLSLAMTQREFAEKMGLQFKNYYEIEIGGNPVTKKHIQLIKKLKYEKCLLNMEDKLTKEKLIRIRIANGLDKAKFARKIGLQKNTYRAVERGQNGITKHTLTQIENSDVIKIAEENINKKSLIDTLVYQYEVLKNRQKLERYNHERLKNLREALKLTVKSFSYRLNITPNYYNIMESGKQVISRQIMIKLKEIEATLQSRQ